MFLIQYFFFFFFFCRFAANFKNFSPRNCKKKSQKLGLMHRALQQSESTYLCVRVCETNLVFLCLKWVIWISDHVMPVTAVGLQICPYFSATARIHIHDSVLPESWVIGLVFRCYVLKEPQPRRGGGGGLTCQRYTGMCRFDDPLFRLLRRSRDPPCLHLVSVLMPSFLRNIWRFLGSFLSDFGKILAPNTLILVKNLFPRP